MTEHPLHGDDAWLEADTANETLGETAARGGALNDAGRRAAIGAALPVLGQYFASGSQPLSPQRALRETERDTDDPQMAALLGGLRIRVALAAAERLARILRRIVARATFRYQLQRSETTGAITGQLDVNRYVTALGLHRDVPTYPVLEVRRTERTSENILAVYAARWLVAEMRSAFTASGAPTDGPEHEQYVIRCRELESLVQLPGLAACQQDVAQVNRRRAERDLVANVKRRLRRREIANATPYAELVDWVDRVLSGKPAADPGELDWSFYGDRFDTKLFELWCLHTLAVEISRNLAAPVPALNRGWRTSDAAYTWQRYAGKIELYYQRSPQGISTQHRARWSRADSTGRPLGGIPDIVVHAVWREAPRNAPRERFAIIDPKLRQRGGPPVEELYKILGYFDNFGLTRQPLGAILFHTTVTDGLTGYRYRLDEAAGDLFAIRLNPAMPLESQNALSMLARAILALLDIPPLDDAELAILNQQVDPEQEAEMYYAAQQRELAAYAENLPARVLNASRQRWRITLGDRRWRGLTVAVQTMLATAEYLGFNLLADAEDTGLSDQDFSGPVIGVCASIESILHDQVIGPSTAHDSALAKRCERATLGTVVALVDDAINKVKNRRVEHDAVRDYLRREGFDVTEVSRLIAPLREVNQRFRVPAAHRAVLGQHDWSELWKNATVGGLFANLVDTLLPSSGE